MAFDPTIPIWPCALAPSGVISRRRKHPVNLAPEPIGGAPQSVVADAGRWEISYGRIVLLGARILAFRAIVFDICAPLRPVYVPMFDGIRTPRRRANIAQPPGVPFSDAAPFSDASLFLDQPVDFVVAAAAPPRSVSLSVASQGLSAAKIVAGQYIGLGERAHVVTKAFPTGDGEMFILSIWPPLRAAAAAGDPVWTENPVVKCIVDPSLAEVADDLDMGRIGYVDVTFAEARW